MKYYVITSKPSASIEAGRELKFFEWLKHQEKTGKVREYWALRNRPGIAAILKMNFESELEEFLAAWNERAPAEFAIEPLMSKKALDAELAKKLLG